MSNGGITFEVFLEGDLAMRVIMDQRLQHPDVMRRFQALGVALTAAEKQRFQDYGAFNWEIDGRAIQILHTM